MIKSLAKLICVMSVGLITISLIGCTTTSTGKSADKSGSISSSVNSKIRFYRVNKLGQQYDLIVVKGTTEPGCHNFFKRSNLHRVGQNGFAYCEVYAEKNCQAGTQLTGQWAAKRIKSEEKKHPTTKFTKGSRWLLSKDSNVKAYSWNCVATD